MTTASDRNGSQRIRPEGLPIPILPASAAPVAATPNKYLETLVQKLQLVRTLTRAVAEHYMTGFFLWGSGGVGKTYTVTQQLIALETDFKVWNSRVTGWGLVNNLEKYPSHVHLIE